MPLLARRTSAGRGVDRGARAGVHDVSLRPVRGHSDLHECGNGRVRIPVDGNDRHEAGALRTPASWRGGRRGLLRLPRCGPPVRNPGRRRGRPDRTGGRGAVGRHGRLSSQAATHGPGAGTGGSGRPAPTGRDIRSDRRHFTPVSCGESGPVPSSLRDVSFHGGGRTHGAGPFDMCPFHGRGGPVFRQRCSLGNRSDADRPECVDNPAHRHGRRWHGNSRMGCCPCRPGCAFHSGRALPTRQNSRRSFPERPLPVSLRRRTREGRSVASGYRLTGCPPNDLIAGHARGRRQGLLAAVGRDGGPGLPGGPVRGVADSGAVDRLPRPGGDVRPPRPACPAQ